MMTSTLYTSTYASTGKRTTTLTNYLFYLFINRVGGWGFRKKGKSNPMLIIDEVFHE
jgi:hypothetical protein